MQRNKIRFFSVSNFDIKSSKTSSALLILYSYMKPQDNMISRIILVLNLMFYLYWEKIKNTVLAELQSMEGNTCTALVM